MNSVTADQLPQIPTDQLQEFARMVAEELRSGKSADRAKSMTLGELFRYWHDNHAVTHTKSAKTFRAHFRLYLIQLSTKKLDEIRRSDIVTLQTHLKETRNESAANKSIQLLQMLFNKAIDWELYDGPNPASRIRKFASQPRDRFLQPEEIQRFLVAVESIKNARMRDYFKMLLWCGQRRSNVSDMRWEDIDLNRATWRIPMTKNGTSHLVPLTSEAMAILEQRKGDSRVFVFPLEDGTKGMYHVDYQWNRVLKIAGLSDFTMHDLRRSLASWQVITGASLPVVGRTLNHKSSSSTEIYACLNLAPVRSAMETANMTMKEQALDVTIDEIERRAAAPGGRTVKYGSSTSSTRLTFTEQQVLQLLADGLTYQQIGEQIGRVQGSVAEAARRIAGKLGVEKSAGVLLRDAIVQRAAESGLIPRSAKNHASDIT